MTNHTPKPVQIPLPLDGETIEIPLTKGYVAIVDAVDADLLAFRWFARVSLSGIVYAIRNSPMINGHREPILMHRLVLQRKLGRNLLDSEITDHKNGDGRINTRDNLRLATCAENAHNMRRHAKNASGYKGVSKVPGKDYWVVKIQSNGEGITVGYYKTPEDAAVMYNYTATKLHGEFARLNQLEGWEQRAYVILNTARVYSNNLCGYAGVSRCGKKWRAVIDRNKKRIHVGVFDSPLEAHEARVARLKELGL